MTSGMGDSSDQRLCSTLRSGAPFPVPQHPRGGDDPPRFYDLQLSTEFGALCVMGFCAMGNDHYVSGRRYLEASPSSSYQSASMCFGRTVVLLWGINDVRKLCVLFCPVFVVFNTAI